MNHIQSQPSSPLPPWALLCAAFVQNALARAVDGWWSANSTQIAAFVVMLDCARAGIGREGAEALAETLRGICNDISKIAARVESLRPRLPAEP